MKLHPEDPRLTAFLLGELPVDEAAAVELAVAEDPALQTALRELEVIQQLLTNTLAPKTVALLPGQRENIRLAAKSTKITPLNVRRKSWKPWILPLAAAAVITLIAVISAQKPGSLKQAAAAPAPEPVSQQPQRPGIRLLPAPGPLDPGQSLAANSKATPQPGSELPALHPRTYLAAADFPTLDLPVQSGKSSLDWIRKSILTKHEMPDRNAVRLEEILNSFSFRPAGMTVVARLPATGWHPDNRDNGMTSHAATIATETLACPWKPSATLVLISIRGNPYSDCEIKAAFRANPANVHRYRLLGFSPVEGQDTAPLPTLLPAKSSNTLVIEVEPSTVTGELGVIEWSVNGQSAAPVTFARHGAAEPSDDARFAALVCTYAQWLTGDPAGLIDVELLAAQAREIASSSLSGDRAEFLHLIDQSLDL
jgi:anti-sigma factor RsiW